MNSLLLVLVLPILALPFIRRSWSVLATYVIYGALTCYFLVSLWFHLTHESHISADMSRISAALAILSLLVIWLARFLYKRKTDKFF